MPEESGCADSLVFPSADPLALLPLLLGWFGFGFLGFFCVRGFLICVFGCWFFGFFGFLFGFFLRMNLH